MRDDKTSNSPVEMVGLTIIMSLYSIFSIYYFPILLMLFPIPYIIYGVKDNLISSVLSLITTLIIIGIVHNPIVGLSYFLLYGPFIFISIYLIKKRTKANRVVFYSATIFFTSILILFKVLNMGGFDIVSQLEEGFSYSLSTQMDIFKDMGLTSYELLERREFIKSNYETFFLILPTIMLISTIIISYSSYLLTTLGLRKIGLSILNMPSFSRFKLPDNFILGSMIMILSAYIITRMNISYADSIYINIMILLGIVLFVQGTSVLSFFLVKIKMKKFMRVITYVIIFFTPQIFKIISILGGIDVIYDLRKIKGAKSM